MAPRTVWEVVWAAVSSVVWEGISTAIRQGVPSAARQAIWAGVCRIAGYAAGQPTCPAAGWAVPYVAPTAIQTAIRKAIRTVVACIAPGTLWPTASWGGGHVAESDSPLLILGLRMVHVVCAICRWYLRE